MPQASLSSRYRITKIETVDTPIPTGGSGPVKILVTGTAVTDPNSPSPPPTQPPYQWEFPVETGAATFFNVDELVDCNFVKVTTE